MEPPIAPRIPVERTLHGDTVVDDYRWLSDPKDPRTLAYLEAENAHTEAATRHLTALRDRIFDEIKQRTQETDLSAPVAKGGYWYATRTDEGRQYPTHVRMVGDPEGPEQVLIDVNALAEGHEYLRLGVLDVSPDGRWLAYSTDVDGSELYTLRFRDLDEERDLDDELTNTYYSSAWSTDARHFFYTTVDAMHRPDKVWRHEIGTPQTDDVLVLHEDDDRMFVSVELTQDERFIVASAGSQTTADARFIPSDDVDAPWTSVMPRIHGVEYEADHKDGRWIVVTNLDAVNGRLLSVDPDTGDVAELRPHDPARKVSHVLALSDHIVVSGRSEGLTSLTVIPDDGDPTDLTFPDDVYTVHRERNLEYGTTTLRVQYQSMVRPRQIIDIDLVSGVRTVVKETPVLGGFTPSDYTSYRIWVAADDGVDIPVSIVHRADLDTSRPAPLLLYGYGSYEATIDPGFSVPRLSLLDRGVIFAIAHVRGGGAMGKHWYEQGKMASKATTFSDFIAVARHLIDDGVTSPDLLVARGASAGGLLMGAVTTMAPDLFAGVIAEVPFVDVITTMLDETLPLTVLEWEEWGNPTIAEQYGWMRAYSPYDNTTSRTYPAMLVTAGLNDPRVGDCAPAQWVAKLRAVASTRGPLLLKTEMGAGHAGPSGRYDAWKDEAFALAFALDVMGRSSTQPPPPV